MNITCPKCSESFGVDVHAVIPKEQVMHLRLTCESELFAARTVGEAIVNMEKTLSAVAEDVGVKVGVFLKSLEVKPHEVTIGFQILDASTPSNLKAIP